MAVGRMRERGIAPEPKETSVFSHPLITLEVRNAKVLLFAQAVKKYGSEKEASKWVAPPLISHHPWGTALDVNYPDEPVGAGWLEVHGWKFGLCRVFKNEWWHFEPVIAPGWKCPALVPDATYSIN